MKDAEQLNMIIKRRVPIPFVEFEQRTLKFTLSKSHKKDAEKDPGLKEGDVVLRVNGQSLDLLNLEEATRLLQKSREKLSLVVQRDVRRSSNSLRWPSQTAVYERLGNVLVTPRQSPTPVHYSHSGTLNNVQADNISLCQYNSQNLNSFSSGLKRFSDSAVTNNLQTNNSNYSSLLSNNYQKNFLHDQNVSKLKTNSQQNLSLNNYTNSFLIQQQQLNNGCFQLLKNNKSYQSQSPHTFEMSQNQQNQTVQYLNSLQKSATSTSSIINLSLNGKTSPASNNVELYSSQKSQHPFPLNNLKNSNAATETNNSNYFQNKLQNVIQVHSNYQNNLHIINFEKDNGNLGIRVIGGNQVGIFVSAVQEDLPAAKNGIRVGDKLLSVNGFNMNGVTREQAVEFLMTLKDEISIQVERSVTEDFLHIKGGQMGDSFYIRTHFSYQKRSSRQELCFNVGDIFHVTDTLAGGSVGYWQVTKVYSANETEIKSNEASGIIPNNKTAEILAKQFQIESSTISRSLFRKKLQLQRNKLLKSFEETFLNNTSNNALNEIFDITLPAYERVILKKPTFYRPVVLFGPLADVAKNLLLTKYQSQFGTVSTNLEQKNLETFFDESVTQISSIDCVMAAQKHCVLLISPGSVERLQLAQYAPIVILIDVDSRNRIRELRTKAGSTTVSSKKLLEQSSKIKKCYAYLLTATLDASKEDGWFEALCHLICHLQNRRVWMPEFKLSQSCHNLLLFSNQNYNLESLENNNSITMSNLLQKQCTPDSKNFDFEKMNTFSTQSILINKNKETVESKNSSNIVMEENFYKKTNLSSTTKNLFLSQPVLLEKTNSSTDNEIVVSENVVQKNLQNFTTNSQKILNQSTVDKNYTKCMSTSVNPVYDKTISINYNKHKNQTDLSKNFSQSVFNSNTFTNCKKNDVSIIQNNFSTNEAINSLNLKKRDNFQQENILNLNFDALEDSITNSHTNYNSQKTLNAKNNITNLNGLM